MEGATTSSTSSSCLKRVREDEDQQQQVEMMKRQKSYTQILSLLDEEEEEPNQDVSSFITTLQQELSPFSSSEENPKPDLVGEYCFDEQPGSTISNTTTKLTTALNSCTSFDSSFVEFGDDGEGESNKERVMIRHLLEASDDELGIPTERSDGEIVRVGGGGGGGDGDGDDCYSGGGGGVELSFCDGLWEFEDETANYYALLQSQLFM
ncbi:hypothetical protein Syun_023685 [Stephania yunnanensis]|uniref:Uncharacterized protein n=1 Tax=Stephania yunnanensis TaxID=152371 RepID=A0AAP0FA33_9MAGN